MLHFYNTKITIKLHYLNQSFPLSFTARIDLYHNFQYLFFVAELRSLLSDKKPLLFRFLGRPKLIL